MGDNRTLLSFHDKPPIFQLIISLLIILIAGLFLSFVFYLAGTLIFDREFGGLLENTSTEVGEKDIVFLRYLVITQDISLFIIPAIIILNIMNPDHQTRPCVIRLPRINEIGLVIILAFCIFPITSFTGELNSGMHLPDKLSGIEQWMVEKEDSASRLIDKLIISDSFWIMMMNVIIIAVIPAIGEEMIFRGVFQKLFQNLFKSGHTAIWVTSFFFSAIHFQFFGFVPRFILGLVFGYLFFWSGTLWLPVISHFVNNAVPVIGTYLERWEKFNSPPEITLWGQTRCTSACCNNQYNNTFIFQG